MTSRELTNVAASVKSRLLNMARTAERPYQELLQYYGMERFLYRLSQSPYATDFVLKGALLFYAWRLDDSRATLDIDLLARTTNTQESLLHICRQVCEIKTEVPDGVVFDARACHQLGVRRDRVEVLSEYLVVRDGTYS